MGQGRQIRHAVQCVLLIVSAMQGITPDARDLASPLALRLVGTSLLGRTPHLDDDDLPAHAACEALQACHETRPETGAIDEGSSPRIRRSPREDHRGMTPGLGPATGLPRVEDLSRTLCRLVC